MIYLNYLNLKKVLTDKEKINIIMKQNLIYPILEDFMRYNKTIEKYDKKIQLNLIKIIQK